MNDVLVPGSSAEDVWNTPERQALREMVTDFTRRHIVPNLPDWEDQGALPRTLHKQAADLGLLELGVPESAGGAGEFVHFLVANEALILAGGSTGVCSALFTHSIGTPHIVAAGDPWQIDTFVRPALAGEMIAALGVTEPGTGSDVGAITTRAVKDGDEYVVNGAKTFITSGTRADFVTTAVRTGGPGHRGVSLLIIETDRDSRSPRSSRRWAGSAPTPPNSRSTTSASRHVTSSARRGPDSSSS